MRNKLGIAFLTLGFVIVLIWTVSLPIAGHRVISNSNVCINNLRTIDAAKFSWAAERFKTNGAEVLWDDILPYMNRGTGGKIPQCPNAGPYEIGKVGEKPRCSVGGEHTIP